jgi:hypothetical protein
MEVRKAIQERAEALREFPGQRIPGATPEVMARAEEIAGGTIYFYGATPVKIGWRGIDWTGRHLAHQEWPAQLNRFYYLGPLAAAYLKTRDERYAEACRAYIEDWISGGESYGRLEECRPGDNTLNISIRLGTSQHSGWGGVLWAFLGSPAFEDVFLGKVMEAMAEQADFLARHLTAWGNWRISQLDALVFTALRFPFLPGAREWLRVGAQGMRNALARQFLPDGVHIERTPGYAHWMADVLASYCLLAKLFPEAEARVDPEIVKRALDYGAQSDLFGVNDATAPHRDPGHLRGLERRRERLRRLFPGRRIPRTPPKEQVFAHAGQVFVRSGWRPGADYLAFDASTWGGGHGHLSRLSFAFRSRGRMLVADPGILSYEMSNPFGPHGKSTRAHSTLNVNGWNQSAADAHLLRTEFTPATALIQARYDGGYWEGEYGWNFTEGRGRGAWGNHERVVFWVRGEYLLALDTIEADPGAEVRNVWQLGPMEEWKANARSLTWWSKNKDANLFLQMALAPEGTVMECWEGSRQPLRGWVGNRGDDAASAPLVEFRCPAGAWRGAASAVLLVPYSGPTRPACAVRKATNAREGLLHHLEVTLPDGGMDHVAWSKNLDTALEGIGGLATDATFVWLRTDASGRPKKCFRLDGSYLEFRGREWHAGSRRRTGIITLGKG